MTAFIEGPRVLYWHGSDDVRNFGDYLTKMLLDRALLGPSVRASRYRLIGSIIDDRNITADLSEIADGGKIAFWACGARDAAPLRADLLERCLFFGARGPLTRDLIGLPKETTIGDTGLLTPLIHPAPAAASRHGRTICVPHFYEPRSDDELLALTGAEQVVRPTIAPSLESLESLLDQITGAAFVLAGAMHAAIIAHAYGTPFAFFDSGHLDAPFKWRDFAASINISAVFVDSVADGVIVHDTVIRRRAKRLPLLPILENSPYHVRPSVLLAAAEHDGLGAVPSGLVEALRRSPIESEARRRASRDSECERDDRMRGFVSDLEGALRAEADNASAASRQIQEELTESRSELADARREVARALSELAEANQEADEAKGRLEEASRRSLEAYQDLSQRHDELMSRLAEAEGRIDASSRELEAQASAHEAKTVSLEQLIDELRKELAETRRERQRALREMSDAVQIAEAEAREARATAVAVNAALGAAAGETARLERDRWQALARAKEAAEARDEARRAVARLEEGVQRAAEAREDLLSRHGALQARLADAETQFQLSTLAVEALRSAAEEARVAAAASGLAHAAEIARLEAARDELTADLAGARHERDQALSELHETSLRARAAALEAERVEAALHREAQAHDALVTQLLGDLSLAGAVRSSLEARLGAAQRRGDEFEALSNHLTAEIEVLRKDAQEGRLEGRLGTSARDLAGSPLSDLAITVSQLLARLDMRRRDWAAAERRHGRILLRRPGRSRVWVQYGHALKEQDEGELAVAAYARAISLDPEDFDAAVHLSHCLRNLGRHAEADALDAAFAPPDVFGAPGATAAVSARARRLGSWRRLQRAAADLAARAGDWPRAVRRYEVLVRMAPGNPALWLRLGEARAAQGDLKGAWYAYAKALRFDPALSEAYRRLGPMLRRLGHSALADQAEVRAFQLSPSDPGYRDALVARGWSPAALVDLVLYAKTRPACASHLPAVAQPALWTARWAARRKHWTSAARRYGRLAASTPGYQPVWTQLGHALKEGGDLAAAEGAYLQALALAPDDADIHLQLGHALKRMGRRAEAAEAYRRASELKPTWDEARHERDALEGRSSATADPAAPDEAEVAAETPPTPIAAPAVVEYEAPEVALIETPPPSLTRREARYWRDLRRALGAAPGA